MPQLFRPRTDCQRQASIGLVNIVFLTLLIWLLSDGPLSDRVALGIDAQPTASVTMTERTR